MGRTATPLSTAVPQLPSRIHVTATTTITTAIITTIIVTVPSIPTMLWSSKETTTMFISVVVHLTRGMKIIDTTTTTTGMAITRDMVATTETR
jgi:hypothetical protein